MLLLSMASCSLDRIPLDTISEESFFKTKADFELAANNFYYTLASFSYGDANSDIARGSSYNSISNGTNTIPETDKGWDDRYASIRSTSYLIMKVEESEIREEVEVYGAEAKFFRAYTYFELVKKFGGVPLITSFLDVNSPELWGGRASRKDIFTQIFKDLDEAIPYLPLEKDIPEKKKGRLSKAAAQAFKARVSLFEGTWRKFRGEDGNALLDEAIKQSDAVMAMAEYELFDRRDVFSEDSYYFYFFNLENDQSNPESLTKQDQKEIVLARKYDSELAAHDDYTNYLQANRLGPTKKMAEMYLCIDGLPINKSPKFEGHSTLISEYENRDLRMKNNMLVPYQQYWGIGGNWGKDWSEPTKGGFICEVSFGIRTSTGYNPRKLGTERLIGGEGNDYPVIRYAEILLIYAEAVFEKNGSISDSDLDKSINIVRKRAGLPRLTNAFVTVNGLNMQEEIRRERTVEFTGENFRFDDLRRWYTAHIELNEAVKGVKYKGTEFETHDWTKGLAGPFDAEGFLVLEEKSSRMFDKDKNYLFPIPSKQILINTKLEQNPNWN